MLLLVALVQCKLDEEVSKSRKPCKNGCRSFPTKFCLALPKMICDNSPTIQRCCPLSCGLCAPQPHEAAKHKISEYARARWAGFEEHEAKLQRITQALRGEIARQTQLLQAAGENRPSAAESLAIKAFLEDMLPGEGPPETELLVLDLLLRQLWTFDPRGTVCEMGTGDERVHELRFEIERRTHARLQTLTDEDWPASLQKAVIATARNFENDAHGLEWMSEYLEWDDDEYPGCTVERPPDGPARDETQKLAWQLVEQFSESEIETWEDFFFPLDVPLTEEDLKQKEAREEARAAAGARAKENSMRNDPLPRTKEDQAEIDRMISEVEMEEERQFWEKERQKNGEGLAGIPKAKPRFEPSSPEERAALEAFQNAEDEYTTVMAFQRLKEYPIGKALHAEMHPEEEEEVPSDEFESLDLAEKQRRLWTGHLLDGAASEEELQGHVERWRVQTKTELKAAQKEPADTQRLQKAIEKARDSGVDEPILAEAEGLLTSEKKKKKKKQKKAKKRKAKDEV